MIKLIASDLDGTALLDGRLSQVNKRTIEKCLKSGVEFAVATGRGLASIPQDVKNITGITYAITSNGACIYNIKTHKILRRYMVSSEDTRKLAQIARELDTGLEIFVGSEAYVDRTYYDNPVKYGMPEKLVDYVHTSRRPISDIYEFIDKHAGEIESFAFVTTNEVHEAVKERVQRECPETLVIDSEPQWVEVINKECGKGNGVKHLAEYLKIALEDVAVFGDADNDIEMFEVVGMPVAMANASKGCKALARYETSDVKEDGLSEGIENILSGRWK